MAAVDTKIYTQVRGGGEPIEEFPAEILLYGYRISRSGPLEISLNLDHEKSRKDNIEVGVHEVVVERNGSSVWVGLLNVVEEVDDEGLRNLTFYGEDGFGYTKKMFVTSDLVQSSVDQFTILKDLVDHHQNKAGGDFGIDVSTIGTSGVTRDRTYFGHELKNIHDAIVELSEVEDGFEFRWEHHTRKIVAGYPRLGIRDTNLVWDERCIRRFARRFDAGDQASQIHGVGEGEGIDMLRQSVQSSSAVSKYGLTQGIYTNKDVKIAATLKAHIDRELALFSDAPETIAITVSTDEPPLFSYGLGYEGRVVWPSPYDPVNEYRRLLGFDVVYSEGEEQAVLDLDVL